jgi:imidazolonepropionase-like amidohydrolase
VPVLAIDGEKIAAIHAGAAPPGVETLSFPGCTVLPGLIDTHVHLNLPGDGSTLEEIVRESDGVLVATSTFNAMKALEAGITTVRDVGAARSTVFDVRRAQTLGHGGGARIVAGGQPITITGGHTWYFGGEADGPEALRRKVRGMVKQGADFIKVMATGGGTVGTMSWLPSFSLEELRAIADEAHRMDRKATAHCLCGQAIDWVTEAGFDQIEHGWFLTDAEGNQAFDPKIAEKVARAGIPVTGTLAVGGSVLKVLGAKADRTALEQRAFDRWRAMFDVIMEVFGRMHAAGVTYVAGTDAGWRYTPMDCLAMEVALMAQGGMRAMDAIVSATGFAASVIGVGDRVGTLKPGLAADMIVVPGNPLDDLTRLETPRLVMQSGKIMVQRAA